MGAKTLSVRLEGDRQVAKWLQMDHLNRCLYELEDNNKQRLEIVSSRRNFFTQDGQFIGEIYIQTVYGATTAIITGASGKEEKAVKQPIPIQTDQIIPCFIVTGTDRRSTEIIGYIACLSGTFKPPYKWFPKTTKDVQLSQFLASGYNGYIEENSLPDYKILSSIDPEVLMYLKPSGIAPDNNRYTTGNPDNYGGSPESLGSVQLTNPYMIFPWVYVAYYSHNVVNSEVVNSYEYLFDGSTVGSYRTTQTVSGTYTVWLGECSGFASSIEVYPEVIIAFSACFSSLPPPEYYNSFTNGLGRNVTTTTLTENSYLLDDLASEGLRIDGSLATSLQLVVHAETTSSVNAFIADHVPDTPFEAPIFDGSQTGTVTSSNTFGTFLTASINTDPQYNVNDELEWGSDYGYSGIAYGYNLAYDKRQDISRAIAVVKAGPDVSGNVTYESMGCIYLGPNSSEISGSVAFELINDNFDRYAAPPIALPDGVSGRIRGHVFFGLIRTQKILTEI